ncbi:MAG: serine/threonine protein kinase, partial [Candidatus Azotimanducaceae bacterium]
MTDLTDKQDETVLRDDVTIIRADALSISNTPSQSTQHTGVGAGKSGADVPKVLKQRFVLEEKIGSGGMGTVFRSKDLRKVEARDSQPYVAVKVLNNDFRQHPEAFIALEREASKSQTLRHTNIVSIFDFDKDANVPFITMELLEGEELADTLRQYPNGLPHEMAWQIIDGMVSGLDHAHTEGVVHADFKPGNVFITNKGSAKVLDFGIARAVRSNQVGEDTDFDPARLAALTPAYASREMLNGDNPEPRDDLYSLGVVMYMVLAGRHPFGRLPATDAASEGLTPDRIKGISRRQWRVIQSCLDFNRQGRPADAQAVHDALFGRPTWQRWALVASVSLLGLSLGSILLYEPPDITEVREEVRQETLVEAQVKRIGVLLADPLFDNAWQHSVLSELDALRHIDVLHKANASLQQRVQRLFGDYIGQVEDLDLAVALYQETVEFEQLDLVREQLLVRLRNEVSALQEDNIDTRWLRAATHRLALIDELFPDDQELNSVRTELASRVQDELPTLLASQTEVASDAWDLVENAVADEGERLAGETEVQKALDAAQAREARAAFGRARLQARTDVEPLINVSCLRLDVKAIGQYLAGVLDAHRPAAQFVAMERFRVCESRLQALDENEAARLTAEIETLLAQATPRQVLKDPCSGS